MLLYRYIVLKRYKILRDHMCVFSNLWLYTKNVAILKPLQSLTWNLYIIFSYCKQDIFVSRHVNTRSQFVEPRRPHPRFYDGIVNSPYGSYAEDVPSSRAENWNDQRTLANRAVYSTTRPEGARSSYLADYKHTFSFGWQSISNSDKLSVLFFCIMYIFN